MDVETAHEMNLLKARLMPRRLTCFGPSGQARVVLSGSKVSGAVWVHTIDLVPNSGGEIDDIPLESVAIIRELLEPFRVQKLFQNRLLKQKQWRER